MEYKKRTIIWEDNSEPPKNYIWVKADNKPYEFNYYTHKWEESNSVEIDPEYSAKIVDKPFKKTIVYEENNTPSRDSIWVKKDGVAYEFNKGEWKVNDSVHTSLEREVLTNVPLTFEILSDGYFCFTTNDENRTRTIQYKKNDGEWTNISSEINQEYTKEITITGEEDPYIYIGMDPDLGNFAWSNGTTTIYNGYNLISTGQYLWDASETNIFIAASIKNEFVGTKYEVVKGDILQFKGNNSNYNRYGTFSNTTCEFNVIGNIMSLINSNDFSSIKKISDQKAFYWLFDNCKGLTNANKLILPATTLSDYCYSGMFRECTNLVTTPKLPALTLRDNCYAAMFSTCVNLKNAPDLPATVLAEHCYDLMFYNCTSLITTVKLPVTDLKTGCYENMFYGCSSLTIAPELPATTIKSRCYYGMFRDCTNLIKAPELPATTIGYASCYLMFSGCTSLTTAPTILPATTLNGSCYRYMFSKTKITVAPELPATTLTEYCYGDMFSGCTSLTTAPELPATTLAECCYDNMFWGCTSLTTAPELPATTLARSCYRWMFYNCTSLTQAPELPAKILVPYCYNNMFYKCRNLNNVKCLATDMSASNCIQYWLSVVSETGTFIKDPSTTWPTGSSGIPTGWTVENYYEPHDSVDLGLPSGTLWATMNVGANAPEEDGNYYAFGEIETKSNYTTSTYKFYDEQTSDCTKYNSTDGISELELEDDVANLLWGGYWRIPEYSDYEELVANCTKTEETINNKQGYRFTSNINGNSIFIARPKEMRGTSLSDSTGIWSSTVDGWSEEIRNGVQINLSSNVANPSPRFFGMVIRPVMTPESDESHYR